jgi:hypothetical protein
MKADSTHLPQLFRKRIEQKLKRHVASKSSVVSRDRLDTLEVAAEIYDQYNPNFEETAYMVIAGLSIIIQRINYLNNTDPNLLKRLSEDFKDSDNESEQLPPERVAAVERLVLSLLAEKTPAS